MSSGIRYIFFPTSLTDFIGFFLLFLDGVDFNWGEVKPCCDFYLYLSDGIFFRVSVGHLFILLSDSFALQKRLGEISLVSCLYFLGFYGFIQEYFAEFL